MGKKYVQFEICHLLSMSVSNSKVMGWGITSIYSTLGSVFSDRLSEFLGSVMLKIKFYNVEIVYLIIKDFIFSM